MSTNLSRYDTRFSVGRRRTVRGLGGGGLLAFLGTSAWGQNTPVKGGILKVSAPANPSSLDPITGGSGADHPFLYTVFDTLTEFDFETLEARPGLATWSFPDPNTMVLTLQSGVVFHDGTPCDAQAVKFNLDRARTDPRSNVKSDLATITAVEVTGALEVKLTLNQPDTALPGIFADRAGMMASPAAIQSLGNAHDRNPVGAGAWKFVGWGDNQRIVVTRNEAYWRASLPNVDGIEIAIIPELATGLRSVIANQNHICYGFEPRYVPLVQRAKNVRLVQGPSVGHQMFYFNYSRGPLSNVKVRQAFNFAINREAFVKATMGGIGEIASQNLPSAHWAYDKSLEGMYAFNPERAKQLLAEAGYPNGVELTVGVYTDQDATRRRELFVEQLGAVGIRCRWTAGTIADTAGQFFGTEKKFDALLASWTGRPDPSMTYSYLYAKDSYYNAGRTEVSEELTALLQQSRLREDKEFRIQVFAKIQRIAMEQALSCPIAYNFDMAAVSSLVQDYRPNLLGKPKFSNVWLSAK